MTGRNDDARKIDHQLSQLAACLSNTTVGRLVAFI